MAIAEGSIRIFGAICPSSLPVRVCAIAATIFAESAARVHVPGLAEREYEKYAPPVSDPLYDGLCGVPSFFSVGGGKHLRCRYEHGHGGDHEWKKHEEHFTLFGGISREGILRHRPALFGIPRGCRCTPVFAAEGWAVVDYVFSPECEAHAKKPRA